MPLFSCRLRRHTPFQVICRCHFAVAAADISLFFAIRDFAAFVVSSDYADDADE